MNYFKKGRCFCSQTKYCGGDTIRRPQKQKPYNGSSSTSHVHNGWPWSKGQVSDHHSSYSHRLWNLWLFWVVILSFSAILLFCDDTWRELIFNSNQAPFVYSGGLKQQTHWEVYFQDSHNWFTLFMILQTFWGGGWSGTVLSTAWCQWCPVYEARLQQRKETLCSRDS